MSDFSRGAVAPLSAEPDFRSRPSLVLAGAGLAFLVGYGLPIASALYLLFNPLPPGGTHVDPGSALSYELSLLIPALAIGFLVSTRLSRRGPRAWLVGARPRHRGAGLACVAWIIGALDAGVLLAWALGLTSSNTGQTDGWSRGDLIVQAMLAGVGEELLVVALPYLVISRIRLRDNRVPFPVIVGSLTAMRLSYHLYYGAGAVALLPWAVTAVLLYARYQRVWPLILTHAAYDASVSGVVSSSLAALGLIATPVVFGLLAAALRRRPEPVRAAGP